MRLRDTRRIKRGGFTLIEIMIVILIIAILASLVSVVGNKALKAARRAGVRQEISQLELGIAHFQTTYGVPYIPSIFLLDETGKSYFNPGSGTLAQESIQYLQRVFNRPFLLNASGFYFLDSSNNQVHFDIDWNGDGIPGNGSPVVLEGHQCLVFFLGGIQGTQGFSTVLTKPSLSNGGPRIGTGKGPDFEFQPGRLKQVYPRDNNLVATSAGMWGYFSYMDPYGNYSYDPNTNVGLYGVYAYFSSYKAQNAYRPTDCSLSLGAYLPSSALPPTQPPPNVWVQPYLDGNSPNGSRFFKPNGFQIISPGSDGYFGNPGTPWSPANAGNLFSRPKDPGADDLSNFYETTLGSSQ